MWGNVKKYVEIPKYFNKKRKIFHVLYGIETRHFNIVLKGMETIPQFLLTHSSYLCC